MTHRAVSTGGWRRSAIGILSAILIAVVTETEAQAQAPSASALKAAFVFNFVRFTDWPAEALHASAPIVVCMLDAGAVSESFRDLVRGRTIGTRAIETRDFVKDDQVRACHAVYVSGIEARQSDRLIALLQDMPILTISDDERFVERGGIANFLVQKDTMGFAVNVAALQRSKLQLSAKVLALARTIKK